MNFLNSGTGTVPQSSLKAKSHLEIASAALLRACRLDWLAKLTSQTWWRPRLHIHASRCRSLRLCQTSSRKKELKRLQY